MQFEVSERISSAVDVATLINALQAQFKKVSENVRRNGNILEITSIEATFGSINRSDTTLVKVKTVPGGYLMVADVTYKPSIAFWIIFIITLFSWVMWLVPIGFYLYQKKTVRNAVEETFQRIKNEFASAQSSQLSAVAPQVGSIDELEKLGSLMERGLITREEFDMKKAQILGSPSSPPPPPSRASSNSQDCVACPSCSSPIPVAELQVGTNYCTHCGDSFEAS